MNAKEQAWITALQQGDENAFRRLVETTQDMVYNTVLSLVQQPADAEEITQDVYVQVYRSISTFRGEADIRTWLYRIATAKALDHLRRTKARKRKWWSSMLRYSEVDDAPAGLFYHPGVAMEQKEKAAQLFAMIQRLPEKQRVAFTLQQAEGLRTEAIAEIMRLSTGAVEALLFRARQKLREMIEKRK